MLLQVEGQGQILQREEYQAWLQQRNNSTPATSGIGLLSSVPPLVSTKQRSPAGTTPCRLQTLVPIKAT